MAHPRVVAIIQARMGSSRLPGKVLADLGGRSVLARVVRRARRASLIDEVVVATTTGREDDVITRECQRLDTAFFRGRSEDVLDRYYQASLVFSAEVVARITSDNPLVDPDESSRVVRALLDAGVDYASNGLRRTYPLGLETEVMTAAALAHAWRKARQPYERVHVTPYLYEHPETFRLLSVTGREDFSAYRWTVDTPDDLALVRAIYSHFGNEDTMGWRDVCGLLQAQPELAALNGHIRHKALVEC